MMVETVVDPTLTHYSALIANAWIPMGMVEQAAGEVRQQVDPRLQLVQQINLLQVASQDGLEMVYAMMSITMWTAVMMVETVVDPMLTHNTALNANALILMEVAEEGILHHVLLDYIQVIHFVMMKTTMLNATMIMELVVNLMGQSMVNPGLCGTTSAL